MNTTQAAFLIDLAQASSVNEDNDLKALMWVMSSLYKVFEKRRNSKT